MATNRFTGLTMPVFSAFGWAGEDNALNFALSQLELFIQGLYFSLPRETQALFPVHGLDRANQSVYLAANEDVVSGPYIAFFARPMSLEIALIISDKQALVKAYSAAEKQTKTFYTLLAELGADWNLRIQQLEFDSETGATTHYQDLFKNEISELDNESISNHIARAAFLNGESQWVVPIYVSHRISSEIASAMGVSLLSNMEEDVSALVPLTKFLTGRAKKVRKREKSQSKPKPQPDVLPETTPASLVANAAKLEQFTYVSELKPLHIRRGFVNLTNQHWPFFAVNARSETRPVTIAYGENKDDDSSVWRLVPNDQARIVLSPAVQEWLEENFEPYDHIQVLATKPDAKSIQIALKVVD
jgi:hypothetical protein